MNPIVLQIEQDDLQVSEFLLQIAGLCHNFSLTTIMSNHEMAKRIMSHATTETHKLFDECAFATKGTQFLTEARWTQDLARITFMRKSCFISQKEFEGILDQQHTKGVTLHRLNLS